MTLSPNHHDNDSVAVLGGNTLNFSLSVSAGASVLQKKASGDREDPPSLFEQTEICLHKRKEGTCHYHCQTIYSRFDLWLVYLYQEWWHSACVNCTQTVTERDAEIVIMHICMQTEFPGIIERFTLCCYHNQISVNWHFPHFTEELINMWNTVLYLPHSRPDWSVQFIHLGLFVCFIFIDSVLFTVVWCGKLNSESFYLTNSFYKLYILPKLIIL